MAETPREVAERIGKEYCERETVPSNAEEQWRVQKAFDTMADVNARLFADIPVPVEFQEADPYDDYPDMRDTVAREGILRVFSGGDDHPVWDHDTELQARAVHDWYGHLSLDVDFSTEGEYQKWAYCRGYYPAYCDRVFFTEVVGQLGAVFHLPDGFGDDDFEQKVFQAPPEWIEDMARAVRR